MSGLVLVGKESASQQCYCPFAHSPVPHTRLREPRDLHYYTLPALQHRDVYMMTCLDVPLRAAQRLDCILSGTLYKVPGSRARR
jgi:hypothetical protein